jgi:hypothetical protein
MRQEGAERRVARALDRGRHGEPFVQLDSADQIERRLGQLALGDRMRPVLFGRKRPPLQHPSWSRRRHAGGIRRASVGRFPPMKLVGATRSASSFTSIVRWQHDGSELSRSTGISSEDSAWTSRSSRRRANCHE